MASTPGGLRSFNLKVLDDHLVLFASRESVFTLQVSDGFSERVIYWWNGRLFILSSGERSGPGLAAHLVRAGKLAAPDAEAMVQECRRSKTSLEDALLSRQVLTHTEYEVAMRRLVSDELFDLVFWEDALFLSYEAPPPADFFAAEPSLLSAEIPPGQLVEDLTAWIRKWVAAKPLLKSDRTRLRLEEGAAGGDAAPSSPLLDALRKGATFRELRHGVDLEIAELLDHVARWIEAGAVCAGEEKREALTPQQAIEKLERILPDAVGKDLVRLKLANLHKKGKRPDKACSCFQLVADQAAARGDWALAADCLRSVLSIRPDDLAALRQLMKIHTDRGFTRQAVAAALQVGQALLRAEKAEELKAIAETLGGLPGAHLAAQEIRADLKLLSGDVERAIEEYETIASRHEQAGELDRALQLLGKALELDGENDDLKRRLLKLKQRAHGAPRMAGGPGGAERRGALRRARERIAAAAGWLRIGLPIAAGALILGGVIYLALRLPSGAALDVEAVVVDARRPAPPPEPPRDERPKIVVKIPVERLALPGAASPELSGDADAREDEAAAGDADPAAPPVGPDTAIAAAADTGTPPPRESEAPLPPVVESGPSAPAGAAKEPAPAGSAAAAADARAIPRIPTELLLEDALPPRACPQHGTHAQVSRRLQGGKLIRFADDCALGIEDSRTGEILLDVEAPPGSRWAYDPEGDRVLAWKPGEPLTLFTPSPRSSRTVAGWRLPAGTAALAAGESFAALRLGEMTRLVRLEDGAEVRSQWLFPWSEGFFDGDRLLLRREIVQAGDGGAAARPWTFVDSGTLAVIRETEGERERAGDAPADPLDGTSDDPVPAPENAGARGTDGVTPQEHPED